MACNLTAKNSNRRAPNVELRCRICEYDALVARHKSSLDIFSLPDETPADSDDLPPHELIAQEMVDDLAAALERFWLIAGGLNGAASEAI